MPETVNVVPDPVGSRRARAAASGGRKAWADIVCEEAREAAEKVAHQYSTVTAEEIGPPLVELGLTFGLAQATLWMLGDEAAQMAQTAGPLLGVKAPQILWGLYRAATFGAPIDQPGTLAEIVGTRQTKPDSLDYMAQARCSACGYAAAFIFPVGVDPAAVTCPRCEGTGTPK